MPCRAGPRAIVADSSGIPHRLARSGVVVISASALCGASPPAERRSPQRSGHGLNGRHTQADPEKAADGLDELGHRDRLRQIGLATAFADALLVAPHRKSGHRDHRNGLELGIFLEPRVIAVLPFAVLPSAFFSIWPTASSSYESSTNFCLPAGLLAHQLLAAASQIVGRIGGNRSAGDTHTLAVHGLRIATHCASCEC
jgi:hypothetical protein